MIGDMKFLAGCQHQDVDEYGEEIYEQSEKEFSDFIQHMLSSIGKGSGEIIDVTEFKRRLEGKQYA